MSINMRKKVDVYLKDPNKFQLDLQNQKSIWMDNLVKPLGSHYEAAMKQKDGVFDEAKRRKAVKDAALQKIELIQGLVMSLMFMGIDIVSAGAMKNVSVLSKKLGSTKDMQHFIDAHGMTAKALSQYLSQPSSFSNAIVANFDDKVKGMVSTGTATGAISTITALAKDIEKTAPANFEAKWTGPLQYQNEMSTFYSSMSRLINESYVNLVRDSSSDATVKRALIEVFCSLPFVRPPTLSLKDFAWSFKNYFEVSYWCSYIQQQPRDSKFGTSTMKNQILVDVINERLFEISGHYITHKGGQKAATSKYTFNHTTSRVVHKNGIGQEFSQAWDGWVSQAQVNYTRTILKDANKNLVAPIFDAQGVSSAQAHI